MLTQIDELNRCCEAFSHNSIGTKLVAIITMLNEAKTDHNAHTHANASTVANEQIATASLASYNNLFEVQTCCPALERIGTFFSAVKTFLDEYKTDHNAHLHTAAGATPNGVTIAAAVPSLDGNDLQALNMVCPALAGPHNSVDAGVIAQQIITLMTELKTDFNAHVHPSALTNAPTQQITSASVSTLS